jgi:hypothetical protein
MSGVTLIAGKAEVKHGRDFNLCKAVAPQSVIGAQRILSFLIRHHILTAGSEGCQTRES